MAPSAVFNDEGTRSTTVSTQSNGGFGGAMLHRNLRFPRPKVTCQRGNWQWLDNGRSFFDASVGAGVSCVGYRNKRVNNAIFRQLETVSSSMDFSFGTQIAEDFAQALVDSTNGVMKRAYICSSGSEAMEAAQKLARQYFVEKGEGQRTKFIARHQSYHGATLGALSLSGHVERRRIYEPILLKNISHVSPCNPYRGKGEHESNEEYVRKLADELRREFRRLGPNTVVAFVVEPVVGAALGCVPAIRGYLAAMKKVCDDYGALLIVDEVMCGMGRCGTMHAWQQEDGFVPDIQTIGKGLGGGSMPVAGVLASRRVAEVIEQGTSEFAHGQTYQGHPVACAVGLEIQRIIRDEGLLDNVKKMGGLLSTALKKHLDTHRYVGEIRGLGLFWGIELVKDKSTKEPFEKSLQIAKKIHEKGWMEYGIYIYYGTGSADLGECGDHLLIAPAYNINEDNVNEIVDKTTRLIVDFFGELDNAGTP